VAFTTKPPSLTRPSISSLSLKVPKHGKASVSFRLDEAARVTIKLQHKSHGRYGTIKTIPGPTGQPGLNKDKFTLPTRKPGSYRILVAVANAAGASTPRSVSFTIR
jgi:hypothetical protein